MQGVGWCAGIVCMMLHPILFGYCGMFLSSLLQFAAAAVLLTLLGQL